MTGFYYENETFDQLQLAGEDLSQKEFVDCIFQGCDFSEANFYKTDFIDCQFRDCNLSMVVVEQTGWKNVLCKHCKILGVDFQLCSDFLLKLAFEDCQLDYANFDKKKLAKTPFIDCRLESVSFQETDLSEAQFRGSILSHSQFYQTQLSGADFRGASAYTIDPNQNRIRGAKFSLEGVPGLLQQYQIEIS